MIPNSQSIPELPKDPSLSVGEGSPPIIEAKQPVDDVPSSLPTAEPVAATPPLQQIGSPASQSSPFKMSQRSVLGLDDHASSDTHSIRSGRSLGSTVSNTIRHPELSEPGLNSSFIETLSASFTDGNIAKAGLIGEIGLAFNPTDLDGPFGTEMIRLDHLSPNDKLAPNPAFIDALSDKPGHFSVNLGQVTKTQVAFKYQVLIPEGETVTRVPLLIKPQWRVDAKQADCRLHYALNPSYASDSITLSELSLIVHIDTSAGAKIQSCRASDGFKFRKDSNLVYWRLGDVTLTKETSPKPLLARFLTEGEIKPGNVEARWEINGSLASGIGISKLEESKGKGKEVEEDPFADEGDAGSAKEKENWREVASVRKLRSGTYTATT